VPQRDLDQRQDQQRQQLDKAPQARPPGPASLGLGPTCRLLLGAHTLTMDPFGLLAAALLLLTPKAFLLLLTPVLFGLTLLRGRVGLPARITVQTGIWDLIGLLSGLVPGRGWIPTLLPVLCRGREIGRASCGEVA